MAKPDDSIQRLPRSDIPPDYRCPYPTCEFQGKVELSFRGHMATAHGIKYEKAPPSQVKQALSKWNKSKDDLLATPEINQLPSWVCAALAKHVVMGTPMSILAKEGKHSAETLSHYSRSPAGKSYMEQISGNLHDPIKTTRDILAIGMPAKLIDWEFAWQLAVAAKDYEAIHRMAKDIGLQPALAEKEKQGPTTISLHLSMADLGTPSIPTRFIEVMDAEIVEDNGPAD